MQQVRIKWHINTGFSGAKHRGTWTIDKEEWDDMDDDMKDKWCQSMLNDEMQNRFDGGWNVEGDE